MEWNCARLVVFAAIFGYASARAVNISNTWVLPEEGFPVFYRYFRDRISWYEADAVCQFHHANLVTVDSTSQYDAVRAYLKELDISHNVWIGLSRTAEKPNFTWTDFRPLTSDGYWQEAIPAGGDPLCAATDPAADFWWRPLPCGAPTVASFICELEVPSWATGPSGCLLTELPSLTVLYNPEQSAVELTSDCGLDGTKRIACKGNMDREDLMRQLTCTITGDDFDDKSRQPSGAATSTEPASTRSWLWTDAADGFSTRHRRETVNTPSSITSTEGIVREITTTTTTTESVATRVTTANEDGATKIPSDPPISETNSTTDDGYKNKEEITASTEPRAEEATEEYPSAINQGQLFGIIENGTLFDIIELSENGTDHPKVETQTQPPTSTAQPTPTPHDIYTTVIYHKEPTDDSNPRVTKDSFTITTLRINTTKNVEINPNDLIPNPSDKNPSKEPIHNRTNRKELPDFFETDDSKQRGEFEKYTVEYITDPIRFEKKIDLSPLANGSSAVVLNAIDDRLDFQEDEPQKSSNVSGVYERGEEGNGTVTEEPLEPVPDEPKRPNRNRQLTKTKGRSFYPYFFSRVLG